MVVEKVAATVAVGGEVEWAEVAVASVGDEEEEVANRDGRMSAHTSDEHHDEVEPYVRGPDRRRPWRTGVDRLQVQVQDRAHDD